MQDKRETSGQPTLDRSAEKLGWSELVEDLVGVNLRGLRTIATAFIHPFRLFSAARKPDWEGRQYGPTLRVFLFVLAVIVFFQFIWADPDSAIVQSFMTSVGDLSDIDPAFASPEILQRTVETYVVSFPILFTTFALLASLLVRIWGRGTPLLARIRLYYAAIIPSTVFSLFTTVWLAFLPLEAAYNSAVGALLATAVIDGATAYRGLASVHAPLGRLWRAMILSTVNFLALTMAGVAAGIIGVVIFGFQLGFERGMTGG